MVHNTEFQGLKCFIVLCLLKSVLFLCNKVWIPPFEACYTCLFMYALKYNIIPKKIRHWSHIFLRHCCVLETMMRVFFNKGMLIKAAVLDKRAMTEKSIRSFHCSMRTASLASLKIIWPPVQNSADVTIQSSICIFFVCVCFPSTLFLLQSERNQLFLFLCCCSSR